MDALDCLKRLAKIMTSYRKQDRFELRWQLGGALAVINQVNWLRFHPCRIAAKHPAGLCLVHRPLLAWKWMVVSRLQAAQHRAILVRRVV